MKYDLNGSERKYKRMFVSGCGTDDYEAVVAGGENESWYKIFDKLENLEDADVYLVRYGESNRDAVNSVWGGWLGWTPIGEGTTPDDYSCIAVRKVGEKVWHLYKPDLQWTKSQTVPKEEGT